MLYIRRCPLCGGDVEVFSTDDKVECPACGQIVFNRTNSCAEYCKYAEQCRSSGPLKRA
jgi:predicted RNA-binding Zn-ribbon protein involved in translation (DUF1610 family)